MTKREIVKFLKHKKREKALDCEEQFRKDLHEAKRKLMPKLGSQR